MLTLQQNRTPAFYHFGALLLPDSTCLRVLAKRSRRLIRKSSLVPILLARSLQIAQCATSIELRRCWPMETKATEMLPSPAAISFSSHDLFFSLAVPQSLTPRERTVLAQPSLMFQNPGALPNSIFSGSFHFLPLIQPSGKEVRRMTPHLWSQRPWRGHISQVNVNLFMDWQWKEDPRGPLVLTGSMCSC